MLCTYGISTRLTVAFAANFASIISLAPEIVIQAVLTLFFMYPHIGFIMEVHSGIMSAETYPREEFSCCCVSSRR